MTNTPDANGHLKRYDVSDVYIHDLFFDLSAELGYVLDIAEDYIDDLEALVALWTEQGFIEIYDKTEDRQYGRVKDSNSVPGSTPWYIGLYHARLLPSGENDPLVVIVLEEADGNHVISLRFMLDHDDMFGDRSAKRDPRRMKYIRQNIDNLIRRGHVSSDV